MKYANKLSHAESYHPCVRKKQRLSSIQQKKIYTIRHTFSQLALQLGIHASTHVRGSRGQEIHALVPPLFPACWYSVWQLWMQGETSAVVEGEHTVRDQEQMEK